MLDDIIAAFLSLLFSVTLDAPSISREMRKNSRPLERDEYLISNDTIQSEYASFEEDNFPSSREYVELGDEIASERSYSQSFLISLKATLTITSAVVSSVSLGVALIYFDLRTTDLCSQIADKIKLYSSLRCA